MTRHLFQTRFRAARYIALATLEYMLRVCPYILISRLDGMHFFSSMFCALRFPPTDILRMCLFVADYRVRFQPRVSPSCTQAPILSSEAAATGRVSDRHTPSPEHTSVAVWSFRPLPLKHEGTETARYFVHLASILTFDGHADILRRTIRKQTYLRAQNGVVEPIQLFLQNENSPKKFDES